MSKTVLIKLPSCTLASPMAKVGPIDKGGFRRVVAIDGVPDNKAGAEVTVRVGQSVLLPIGGAPEPCRYNWENLGAGRMVRPTSGADTQSELAAEIEAERERQGISLSELARRSGIPKGHLSPMLRATSERRISLEQFLSLMQALHPKRDPRRRLLRAFELGDYAPQG